MKLRVLGTTFVIALCAAFGAAGHHSSVMYDEKKVVEFEAVVKKFQYQNPHCWLIVDVTNKDGSTTTWGFEAEAGGPPEMRKAGIRVGDFPVGAKVKVRGHPMKDGRPAAAWIDATRLSDNKVFVPGRRQQ